MLLVKFLPVRALSESGMGRLLWLDSGTGRPGEQGRSGERGRSEEQCSTGEQRSTGEGGRGCSQDNNNKISKM